MQKESGEPYLDFYKAGYDRGIQNYLSLSLYDENISINDKLLNALVFFKNKEPRVYHLVNSFMRVLYLLELLEEHLQTKKPLEIKSQLYIEEY